MARNKGTFNFAANFQVKMQELLDPRGSVNSKADLIKLETWPHDGDTVYMKEGMLVSIRETEEVYILVSLADILAADYSGWKKLADTQHDTRLTKVEKNLTILTAGVETEGSVDNKIYNALSWGKIQNK